MFLGEPPRTPYDLNFSLFGIPVRVHPFFWLMTLLLGGQLRDVPSVLTWIIAVFVSILVHELGHAVVIRAFGVFPWITLHGMGGVTSYDHRVAFRSKGSSSLGQILISLAGPGAGFLLAAVLVLGFYQAGYGVKLAQIRPVGVLPEILGLHNQRLAALINDILFISVLWGMLNLLPIYPLDGGQIAREFLLLFSPGDGIRLSLWLSVFAAVAMAIVGLTQWHALFTALLFGYLAYSSYATLTAYRTRGPW